IRVSGELSAAQLRSVSAAQLRTFVPATMNVDIRPTGGFSWYKLSNRAFLPGAQHLDGRQPDAD
ncbi:MAG TPA: hypothetical protein VK864_15150, partial [Longimicrobiales bacterium]|nr:hypothetical protein [Longimicrobiales bacterium]